MRIARFVLGIGLVAALAACGEMPGKAPFEAMPGGEVSRAAASALDRPVTPLPGMQAPFRQGSMKLVAYEFRVPEALSVSEANLYLPIADIVWRGDAYGNRKQQVAAMFRSSLEKARANAPANGRPVKAIITLHKFHSLTEKARYTTGGIHTVVFDTTIVDAETGAVLVDGRKTRADLKGYGGRRAMLAERQGLGMKVRLMAHLDRVMAAEVSTAGGWRDKGRKLTRALNQI